MTAPVPLTAAAPGTRVVIARFGRGLGVLQLEQLMSYGLVEGRAVEVLQQRPVTVLLIEHGEVALEAAVADEIGVLPG